MVGPVVSGAQLLCDGVCSRDQVAWCLVMILIRHKHNYSKFSNTYNHQFLTYLTEWRRFFTSATTPSNQQNQQTWSRLLVHYGPPSTETPTAETTTVRCHKNSWIYL